MFPHPVGQPTWQQRAAYDDEDLDFDHETISSDDLRLYTRHLQNLTRVMLSVHAQHVDLQGPHVLQNLRADELWLNAAGLASVHAAALARLLAMSESDRAVYTIQYYYSDTWQMQVDFVTHLECKWRNIGLAMQDHFDEDGPWWEPD